jgi:lipopolysaccharide transport system permease protein
VSHDWRHSAGTSAEAGGGAVVAEPRDRREIDASHPPSQQSSGEYRVIEPGRRLSFGLSGLYARRELLWLLTRRQISARYRQMLLGIVWALLEPLGQLLILTLVFGVLLRVDTGGYPYPLFAFAGMTGWWLFSRTTTAVAGSLQDNMGLVSKVYFPRLILPLAATGKELFDNLLMLVILLAISIAYGYLPGPKVLLLPLILLYGAIVAIGCGLWLAAFMVKFRDIRPMLGLALQAGMYATPVVYSADLVPVRLRPFYELNPMYWVVELARWALLEKPITVTTSFYVSWAAVFLLVVSGLVVFSRYERMTVDVQ